MAPKMQLVDGTYYTPEDLAEKRQRDKAEAKRARAEAGVADLAPTSQIGDEPISVFVARVVSEAIAPLAERVGELEDKVTELSEALTESAKGATAEDLDAKAPEDAERVEGAAGGDSESAAVEGSQPEPVAPSKPSSRGGRTGKAPAAAKGGA